MPSDDAPVYTEEAADPAAVADLLAFLALPATTGPSLDLEDD